LRKSSEVHALRSGCWAVVTFARIDFRLDASGKPHFLECNPLPGLHPANSDLVLLARHALPYEKLVQGVARDALLRLGLPLP
jgi:D-alanine-D-alanine ligase